jgi:hypothetical protein
MTIYVGKIDCVGDHVDTIKTVIFGSTTAMGGSTLAMAVVTKRDHVPCPKWYDTSACRQISCSQLMKATWVPFVITSHHNMWDVGVIPFIISVWSNI